MTILTLSFVIFKLYGAFAAMYLIVGLLWGVQSYRNWSDILPVQVIYDDMDGQKMD
jgi:hypothetical protein